MKKKIISYILTLALIFSLVSAFQVKAEDLILVTSGSCVSEPVQTWSYTSGKTKVYIRKVQYVPNGTWCWVAHIMSNTPSDFRTAKTSSTRPANAENKIGEWGETAKTAANRLNAVLCVNNDYAYGNGYGEVCHGKVIKNATVSYGDNSPSAIYNYHTGYFGPVTSSMNGKSFKTLANNDKLTDTFNFSNGPLLKNGKILANKSETARRQRTFIGTNTNNSTYKTNIWLVVTNGKDSAGKKNDGHSPGLNRYQCAKILKEYGCNYGVNLDGGGSSQMVYKGKVLNADGTRRVSDFVYVVK